MKTISNDPCCGQNVVVLLEKRGVVHASYVIPENVNANQVMPKYVRLSENLSNLFLIHC